MLAEAPMLDRSRASYICFVGGVARGITMPMTALHKRHSRLAWVVPPEGGRKEPYEYIGDALMNGWWVAVVLAV
jgi:hypothetical protein